MFAPFGWGVGCGVWGVGCGVWGVGCWVLGVGGRGSGFKSQHGKSSIIHLIFIIPNTKTLVFIFKLTSKKKYSIILKLEII